MQKFNALKFCIELFCQKFNAKVQCIEVLQWTFIPKVQCKVQCTELFHQKFNAKIQRTELPGWSSALKFWVKSSLHCVFFALKSEIKICFFVWNAGSGLIFVRFPWWNLEALKVCGELRIKLYRRKKPPTVQNDRRMCRWRMGTHHRKTFWEPSQRDKQCIFPIGIAEQIGKVSTSMWYRKNWGAALCLWLRRRLNFHFFVAGFAHEFGLHSMPKIRARTQPFKNMCLAWKPIEQGFENSIHSLVMVALSQKKPWTHIW